MSDKKADSNAVTTTIQMVKKRLGFWEADPKDSWNEKLAKTIEFAKEMKDGNVYQLRKELLDLDDDETEHFVSVCFYTNPLDALVDAISQMLDNWYAGTDSNRMEKLIEMQKAYLEKPADAELKDVRGLCKDMASYVKQSSRGIGTSIYVATLQPKKKGGEIGWRYCCTTP